MNMYHLTPPSDQPTILTWVMVVNKIESALHRRIVYYKQFFYGYVNIAHVME